jgi:hypothetical protein
MEDVRIVLEGTPRAVRSSPVSAAVNRSLRELEESALIDLACDAAVPFQAVPEAGGARLHWIVDSLAPGQRREYALRASDSRPAVPGVKVKPDGDDRLRVEVGGELLTRYIYGAPAAHPCLYPLRGPFGGGVTRAYPQEGLANDSTDHIHHRSLWVAWGDVNGSDNWSEQEGHGRVVHRYFDASESGPVFGRIVALNDWVDAAGRRIMQDRVEFRFYNVPPSFRLFDVDVTLYASDGDVRFGDTKEGGILSVRVARSMEGRGAGRIRNALGAMTESETWGKRAAWCDYVGPVDGHIVGIALFDHPRNFRYPTYWHVRDYGLMTANPFGLSFFEGEGHDGSHVLPAGQNLGFRYRVLIHAGDAPAGDVGGQYLNWVFPPTAAILE